jgi:hypothetical protein
MNIRFSVALLLHMEPLVDLRICKVVGFSEWHVFDF